MSKYPFFAKKGRPSAIEQEICRNVNKLISSGELKQKEIDGYIISNGTPETQEELENFYESVIGEPVNQKDPDYSDRYSEDESDFDEGGDEFEDTGNEFNSGKIQHNPDAVDFSPFEEPVIERSYTQGIAESQPDEGSESNDSTETNNSSDSVEFDENDTARPLDEVTDVEFEEEIPEPEFAFGMTEEQKEEEENAENEDDFSGEKLGGDNLQDLTPAQKRKSAEKTADAILNMYCNFAPLPFKKWASISDGKVQKLKFDNKIDLNMQLENNVTVKDYIDGTNEQVEEIFKVSEETRKEIRDPLIDVLMEQELALTPTQRLLMAVGSHVITMGFSAFQLAQNNKQALETFEKYHQQMNQTKNASAYNEPDSEEKRARYRTNKDKFGETFNQHDEKVVEEMMRQMEENGGDVLDSNHPSIEITEE